MNRSGEVRRSSEKHCSLSRAPVAGMIQNDARDAILLSFPRRGICAGGGDPSGHAADNSSLFLFCSAQTLLWQKKVALPPAILRCGFRDSLRLGFSYQTGI